MYDISGLSKGQSGANHNAYHEKLVVDAKAAYYDGNYSLAERLLEESLRTAQKADSLDSRVIESFHALARHYTSYRDYAKAEQLYRRVLDARKAVVGPSHPDVADSLRRIAAVLRQTWKLSEAHQLERSADEIVQAATAAQHKS
ncbi:MAG TPA: tetratricopeptide repeat protein [Trichormus sp.]|jgi:tetratricopeptide (TPR) repeat protein